MPEEIVAQVDAVIEHLSTWAMEEVYIYAVVVYVAVYVVFVGVYMVYMYSSSI